MMKKKQPMVTIQLIEKYINHLMEEEKSVATLKKYRHDLNELHNYLQGMLLTKSILIEWKKYLIEKYAPSTVNSMLIAVNGYLRFFSWHDLSMKLLKIQKPLFSDENKELTREEYARLVMTASKRSNARLSLILQTICATGIRVSELKFITIEAVQTGRTEISNKGKRRVSFLPQQLRKLLRKYAQKHGKISGPVFTTRTGKPLDRSNIWRDMKALCTEAKVAPEKVFPHNLRHLFARTFYSLERDLSRLADILGHSSIVTTRIYTAESGTIHARQMGRLGLVIT